MELKDFIKTAISDITNAVSELQSELKNGAVINPSMSNTASCLIHFDLSVESSKEGSADIKIASGNVSHATTNRISFDLTIGIPASGGTKPQRPTYENGDTSPCTQSRTAIQKQEEPR